MSNEKVYLLSKIDKQIKLMEQAQKEASTWSVAYVDPEVLSLLKRIKQELSHE